MDAESKKYDLREWQSARKVRFVEEHELNMTKALSKVNALEIFVILKKYYRILVCKIVKLQQSKCYRQHQNIRLTIPSNGDIFSDRFEIHRRCNKPSE